MSEISSGDSVSPGWLVRLPDEVFGRASGLVSRHAKSATQKATLDSVVAALRPRREPTGSGATLVSLPSLVFAALTGDAERALPATVATALLGRGVDLLDDLADGGWLDRWQGYTADELTLAAADLCCAMPPLALAEIDADPSMVLEMQRCVANGFLRASAGQRRDLAWSGRVRVSSVMALKCAAGKAGAFIAIMTTLPAILADARPEIVASCTQFGRNLGLAISVREDCYDLFATGWSQDLEAGTRSYPIALYLERAAPRDREESLELLDRARQDQDAQAEVRRRLVESGIVRLSYITIARYCERAQRSLTRIQPHEPTASILSRLVDAITFT
jgi:hypothetical protein